MDKECEFDLPHASVVKIVKTATSANIQLSKECRATLSKCGGIFALYLSSVANDFCKEKKRSTMKPEDVYDALNEIDFAEFIKPLQNLLEQRKQKIRAGKEDSENGEKEEVGKEKEERVETKRKVEGEVEESENKKPRVEEKE